MRRFNIVRIFNRVNVTLLLIVVSVMFLSFGYASLSATSTIEGAMAMVRLQKDARITNVLYKSSNNGGVDINKDYNINSINGSVNLVNSDSSVTYLVDAMVMLGARMKISDIKLDNEYLDYEVSNYNIGEALCDNNGDCNYGASKEFEITIKYKDGYYNNDNTTYSFKLDFTFEEVEFVAQIGTKYYNSMQDAIEDVSRDNNKTIITLLKNSSEVITIYENQNIEFDLINNTLSNSDVNPVISNNGTLTIKNGYIVSNTTHAAINNEVSGRLIVNGCSIVGTNNKQAIYNGGYLEINGDSYLKASSNQRAAVHNLETGTLVINGGYIVSTKYYGVENLGQLTIGSKDGNALKDKPFIQGETYGVYSTNSYGYYDGVIEGKTNAFNNRSLVSDMEDGYDLVDTTDGLFKKVYLGKGVVVNFDANGGSVENASIFVERNDKIGTLEVPSRDGYSFLGWYTQKDGGTKISEDTIVSEATTYYAHWLNVGNYHAIIGETYYETLQDAINSVSNDNNKVVIKLLQNTSEVLTINANQYIELDIGDFTLKNNGVKPVISNYGTLEIKNGTITSNTSQGAVNNEATGKLYMSGGKINATGTRQAIYNNGGYLEISDDAYLTSNTKDRATVQNLNNGTITILGGTIISYARNALENAGTLTLGVKDGSIDNSTPVLIGETCAINNTKKFYYYDGLLKGKTSTISGNITIKEDNSTRVDDSENINGILYHVTYLQ